MAKLDFNSIASTLTAALLGWAALQLVNNSREIADNRAEIKINAVQIENLKEQK
ncbi:hypothetical protein [Polycladidibacter hongkongensis]|uniref:hypothetical protein n=1 Tax=Polycladidibacter hongkongensis TaxID=1647556 RepID=UPI000AB5B82A|nr:hypothetical protein [Pseudovibrio hongkongensis]